MSDDDGGSLLSTAESAGGDHPAHAPSALGSAAAAASCIVTTRVPTYEEQLEIEERACGLSDRLAAVSLSDTAGAGGDDAPAFSLAPSTEAAMAALRPYFSGPVRVSAAMAALTRSPQQRSPRRLYSGTLAVRLRGSTAAAASQCT